jgi:hypothetical protein
VAAALAVVFLQGLVGTLIHFQVAVHDFCEQHQQFTHDRQHADGSGEAETARSGQNTDPDSPKPHEREPTCHWLAWLHHSGVSTPDLQHDVQLPTPSAGLVDLQVQSVGRAVASVIPLRHVSPINSPPGDHTVATSTA